METLENNKIAYKEIGQDDFISEVIEASKEKLIVVDFWAPWCGPCKDLGPRIEKIISQTDNKVNLIKINIDKNKELASQLNIQSIPTVYAFKDAKIVNGYITFLRLTKSKISITKIENTINNSEVKNGIDSKLFILL